MEKHKAQEMAIRSKKDKEEGEHMKGNDSYREEKNSKEKHQKISGDGDKKIGKCKYCGK